MTKGLIEPVKGQGVSLTAAFIARSRDFDFPADVVSGSLGLGFTSATHRPFGTATWVLVTVNGKSSVHALDENAVKYSRFPPLINLPRRTGINLDGVKNTIEWSKSAS